jgi:4-hydroxy-tetrahydrodipicolinate synthase
MKKPATLNVRGHGLHLVTPFNDRSEVDFPALERILARGLAAGVEFVWLLGPASELPLTSDVEREQVLAFVTDWVRGRVPLVVGIDGSDTRSVVQSCDRFEHPGIAALAVEVPYAHSQAGIRGHFRSVAEASPLPVFMVNSARPDRGGMSVDTALELAHDERFVGLIEASGEVAAMGELFRRRRPDFRLLCGTDALAWPLLALGADGVASAISNVFPETISRLLAHAAFGAMEDARKAHHELAPLMWREQKEGTAPVVKAILHQLGRAKQNVRLPHTPVSEGLKAEIYAALADMDGVLADTV